MKNKRAPTRSASNPVSKQAAKVAEVLAEQSCQSNQLLQQLALTVAANERAQRRFRYAVLIRLSKIETTVQMIHGLQIVEAHSSMPGGDDKARSCAKDVEEIISKKANELGLAMVKYIYDESEDHSPRRKVRHRGSG